MSEERKAVARRFVEEFVALRNLGVVDELIASDFIDHTAGPDDPPGGEGLIQFFSLLQTGFPDFDVVIDDLFGEADKVAMRFTFRGTHEGEFMGIPPTGNRVTMPGIDILRIEEGKIVELWEQEDRLSMMQQLGLFPSSEESG